MPVSRVGGRLALAACAAEMLRRVTGAEQWRGDALEPAVHALADAVPELASPALAPFASRLPRLRAASERLRAADDVELVRVAGRAYESAMSALWLFPDAGGEPQRRWDPWRAKRQGAFFTPRFVAAHLAAQALAHDPERVLDPAAGGGALLLEAFVVLRARHGAAEALRRLHGVELAPELAALSAIGLSFAAGAWDGTRPALLGAQLVAGDSLLAPLEGPRSWAAWFPEATAAGGFGAIVMNPPYGQLKVNDSAFPARGGDDERAREARREALERARRDASATAAALRAHPGYAYARGGVPDLPRFFVERALSLLRPGGVKASIVPSTFLADHRSAPLRAHLLDDHAIAEIDLVPEDARLFAGVNQPTCILVVEARGRTRGIRVRQHVTQPDDLAAREDVRLAPRLIAAADPGERRIPRCDARGAALLERLHRHPPLSAHTWIRNARGELDLTIHRRHLRREDGIQLVRGDQLARYADDLPTGKERFAAPQFLEALSAAKRADVERPRLAGRQCAYLRQPRRLAFALIPAGRVVGNSCNYLSVDAELAPLPEREALLYVLAMMNSSWLEWRFRTTSSTNHVGNYELAALPLPVPDDAGLALEIAATAAQLVEHPGDAIADRRLEGLVCRMLEMDAPAPL